MGGNIDKDTADERAVAGFYARTTAALCAPVDHSEIGHGHGATGDSGG